MKLFQKKKKLTIQEHAHDGDKPDKEEIDRQFDVLLVCCSPSLFLLSSHHNLI